MVPIESSYLRDMADIGQIFVSKRSRFILTPSLGVIPANIWINFTSPETRMIFLPDAENPRSYLRSSAQLHKTPECDGRTDRIPLAITAVCIAREFCINTGHASAMLYFTFILRHHGVLMFIMFSPTIIGGQHYVFGSPVRPSVRPSVR